MFTIIVLLFALFISIIATTGYAAIISERKETRATCVFATILFSGFAYAALNWIATNALTK
jgi:hypothetical protein